MADFIDLYNDLEIAERNLQSAIKDNDKADIRLWKKEIKNTKQEIKELYPDESLV